MHDSKTGGMADHREQGESQASCGSCERLLDTSGECAPGANKAILAKRLKIKQRIHELFQEIDRIIPKGP